MGEPQQKCWFCADSTIFDVHHVVALRLAPGRAGFHVTVAGMLEPILIPVDRCGEFSALASQIFGTSWAEALDKLTGKDTRALGRKPANQ